MTKQAGLDAERFAAWQHDTLAAKAAGSDVLTIGPFQVALSNEKEAPATNRVMLVDGNVTESETEKAIPKLKAALKKHKSALEIEYNEAAFPKVGAWLEAGGLKLARKNALMALRPDAFKPSVAPEVQEAFQQIRWTDGGDVNRQAPPVNMLRVELEVPSSVFLLAWIDWVAAGTGVSHSRKGAAELAGIVTQKALRRRGVAATVTSELVRRHFDRGGDFVFLDAASEEAAKVYEGLGFVPFGAILVYR